MTRDTHPPRPSAGHGSPCLDCGRACHWREPKQRAGHWRHVDRRPGPVERFWAQVDKGAKPDDCWGWTGATSWSGYAVLRWNGSQGPASRFSWELHNGRPVPPGLFTLHRCDNPPCTNPAHLFIGTHTDNMRDAGAKGRLGYWMRKLPREAIPDIQASPLTYAVLARQYGVTPSTIGRVKRGE